MNDYKTLIENRIKEFEKNRLWDKDVLDDLPAKPLLPNKIDYLNEKLSTKIKTKFFNWLAFNYYENLIKKGDFVIKDVFGLENFENINGGCIITCNHFSPLDNYAVFRSLIKLYGKKWRLYKVIKEGNYTSFKGIFGAFFRHCNTLPLSSNTQTMKKFVKSTSKLLEKGEKILIYPEQAMWYNYKKPRPLKDGAYKIAIRNNVPIVPCFITMEDTGKIGKDGFNIQKFTIRFFPPLYVDEKLSLTENVNVMKEKNYSLWKQAYEEFYEKELTYEE